MLHGPDGSSKNKIITNKNNNKMKKNILLLGALALSMAFVSCSNNDDNKAHEYTTDEAQNLDYTSDNAAAWGNYAANVALLLQQDAQNLYEQWSNGYGDAFESHDGESSDYTSAESCVEQIIDGCIDIANEVGESKIGGPFDLYKAGSTQDALYAVESWYSWHSRDDYKNNILSIANSLLNDCISGAPSDLNYRSGIADGSLTMNSIVVKCMTNNNLRAQGIAVWQAVCTAWDAIDDIPQPFRNNIGSTEAEDAIEACATLVDQLKALKNLIAKEEGIDWQPVVDEFVEVVAVPTYKDLASKTSALYNAVYSLQKNPSNAAFEAACEAWLAARQPWETSEAFLFGPVSELGLDPNMDSWPLDAVGIANLLQSQNWSSMNWSGEYEELDEDDEDASSDHAKAIAAAQSVRGFHTLEFLLFKNGSPRTIK